MTKKVTNRKKATAKKSVARQPAKKTTAKKTSSYYVVDSKGRKTNMKLTLSR